MSEHNEVPEVIRELHRRVAAEVRCQDPIAPPVDEYGNAITPFDDATERHPHESKAPTGFYEAGESWIEPWCEDHAGLVGDPDCRACLGASHDAWMHRAKAAESILAEVRSDLGAALRSARPFVYNVMCEHRGTWRGETAKAVLDAVDAVLDKGAE